MEANLKLYLHTIKGRVYRQTRDGPIGSRLTMAVSRIVMNNKGRLLRERLEKAGLEIHLETCYVDNLGYVLSLLDIHVTWEDDNNYLTDIIQSQINLILYVGNYVRAQNFRDFQMSLFMILACSNL